MVGMGAVVVAVCYAVLCGAILRSTMLAIRVVRSCLTVAVCSSVWQCALWCVCKTY